MSKTVKVISIITAVVLVLGVAATIAVMVATHDPDNPKPGFYLDGNRVKDTGVMLTVGEHEISYPEYRYYYYFNKYYMSMGDSTYWDSDPDGSKAQELKDETEEYIKYVYAWVDLAAERGVGLTQEEKDEILDSVAEDKRTYGTEFKNRLLENYLMDEATYIKIMELQTLQQKIQAEYQTEVETEHADELLDGVVSAWHILVSFDTTAADPDANEAEVLSQAEAIVQELQDGIAEHTEAHQEAGEEVDELEITKEVFGELRAQYDSDGGQTEDGYTFGQGTMVEEFYQGALALEVGEISEPIRTTYGYHIILRVPLDEAYVEANRSTLIGNKVTTLMDDLMQQRMDAYTVVPGEYYDRVSLASVK